MRRARLAALGFVLLGIQAHGEGLKLSVFPYTDQIFHRLLADPRQAQTSLRYYRLNGQDIADVALGNTWGLLRWEKDNWAAQWNVEGMAYSRFHMTGGINEFQVVDFFANVPVELKRGITSGRFTLFHESSHLGDDYIRTTGNTGFRYSVEGVRALGSVEPTALIRLYGGPSLLLHTTPRMPSGSFQWGFELRTPDLKSLSRHPCYLYFAQDFQNKSQVHWNMDSDTELGFRLAYQQIVRSVRFHLGYFNGHSPFGQFFLRREHYLSFGISFDF